MTAHRTGSVITLAILVAGLLCSGCPQERSNQATGVPAGGAVSPDTTSPGDGTATPVQTAVAQPLRPGQWWGDGCDPHRRGNTGNTGPATASLRWANPVNGTFGGHLGLLPDGTVLAQLVGRLLAVTPTGAERWSYSTAGEFDFTISAIPDVRIYVSETAPVAEAVLMRGNIEHDFMKCGGHLTAIDPDREQLWRLNIDGALTGMPLLTESGEIRGLVMVSKGDFKNGFFYGYNDFPELLSVTADGQQNWQKMLARLDPEYDRMPGAVPVLQRNGNLAFTWNDQQLHSFRPDSFRDWEFKVESVPDCPAVGAPGGNILMLANNRPTLNEKQLDLMNWEAMNIYGVLHSVKPGGSRGWDLQIGSDVHSALAVGADGGIHFGTTVYKDDRDGQAKTGRVYSLTEGGRLVYSYDTHREFADYPDQPAPLVDAAGTLYICDAGSHLYAISADGSLKWEYSTPEGFATNPVVSAQGVLYIGGRDGKLYALGDEG